MGESLQWERVYSAVNSPPFLSVDYIIPLHSAEKSFNEQELYIYYVTINAINTACNDNETLSNKNDNSGVSLTKAKLTLRLPLHTSNPITDCPTTCCEISPASEPVRPVTIRCTIVGPFMEAIL